MPHFFDHDAGDGAAIPVGGRILQEVALLLDAGKFGVALINDHVHQRVAHLLRRNLAQILPFAATFIRTELDLFRIDRAVKRIEMEGLDIVRVDADVFAPVVEHPDPVAEGSDFCYFAWHENL